MRKVTLSRKVQMSVGAEVFNGGFIVSTRRVLKLFKKAEIYVLSVKHYPRLPFFTSFVPSSPLEAGCVCFALSAILSILSIGARPEIMVLVIQTIAVFMVSLHAWGWWLYDVVHEYCDPLAGAILRTHGVILIPILRACPLPLVEVFKPVIADHSNLIARKGNYLHSLLTVQKIRNQSGRGA